MFLTFCVTGPIYGIMLILVCGVYEEIHSSASETIKGRLRWPRGYIWCRTLQDQVVAPSSRAIRCNTDVLRRDPELLRISWGLLQWVVWCTIDFKNLFWLLVTEWLTPDCSSVVVVSPEIESVDTKKTYVWA